MAGPLITYPVLVTATGDTTILAGIPGSYFKVWRVLLTCNKAGNPPTVVQLKSGATPAGGSVFMWDGSALMLDLTRRPYGETAVGDALIVNSTETATLRGSVMVETVTP